MDSFIKILADPRTTKARGGTRIEWSKFKFEAPWQITAKTNAVTKSHALQGGGRPVGAYSELSCDIKLVYKLAVTVQTLDAIEDLTSVEHLKCLCYFNPVSNPTLFLTGHLSPDKTDLSPVWSSIPDVQKKIKLAIDVKLPLSEVTKYL